MAATSHPRLALLLGASGKLGRMLQAVWAEDPPQGIEVKPVFREDPLGRPGLAWKPGQSTADLPECAVIFAMWGVTGGDLPTLTANTSLAEEAERLGRDLGAACVVHCSSAAVYGPSLYSLTEESALAPMGAYGQAKLAMEQRIAELDKTEGGPRNVILRIGNVAGADSLFANMRPGGEIRLDRFADGQSPARSYIAAADLAQVLVRLAQGEDAPLVLNVAAPQATQMSDIAEAAQCGIVWKDAPETALRRVQLDTKRLSLLCDLPSSTADAAHMVAGAKVGGIWP